MSWLNHEISNKESLAYTVGWIFFSVGTVSKNWNVAIGASVIALTLDKLYYEYKIAGEGSGS